MIFITSRTGNFCLAKDSEIEQLYDTTHYIQKNSGVLSAAGTCSIILLSSKIICFHLQVAHILLQQKYQVFVEKGRKTAVQGGDVKM